MFKRAEVGRCVFKYAMDESCGKKTIDNPLSCIARRWQITMACDQIKFFNLWSSAAIVPHDHEL